MSDFTATLTNHNRISVYHRFIPWNCTTSDLLQQSFYSMFAPINLPEENPRNHITQILETTHSIPFTKQTFHSAPHIDIFIRRGFSFMHATEASWDLGFSLFGLLFFLDLILLRFVLLFIFLLSLATCFWDL